MARYVADVVTHAGGRHHVAAPRQRTGWVTDHGALAAMAEAGAVLHAVDMRRRPQSPRNVVALARLVALARRVRPDVVHGHSSIGGALGRVVARAVGAAAVYTPNGLATGRAVIAVERLLGRVTDTLVAVSASEAAVVRELGIVPEERVAVVVNGIELDAPPPHPVDLRSSLGIRDDAPLVGCVARLVPQKAPVDAVEAFARFARRRPDAQFVLVGSGPLRPDVDRAASRAGIADRVHVLAFLDRAAAALPQLDALILASRFEGCPYIVLEAYRAGVPVVATDVVGTRDVVEDGHTGLLVPRGDVDGLADALGRVIGDSDRARALAAGGRARLRRDHDVVEMGRRLTEVYQGAVAARR